MRRFVALLLLGTLMSVFGCSGSGSSTAANNNNGGGGNGGGGGGAGNGNSVSITVDGGPAGLDFTSSDVAFADVTVCVPGTNNCQTIDHVAVDTGSSGLRILQSVLTLPLAQEGNLVECFQFVSGFTWGPVMMADVEMAGETASNIPIQVIGQSTFPQIPNDCQNSVPEGGSQETLDDLGANGLLGVSSSVQDCGSFCTAPSSLYYSCPTASTCSETAVSLAQQPPNPVAMFATDNNGVLVQLPAIASVTGEATATGTLFFGIGTEANNGLGTATIFQEDPNSLTFTTIYQGVAYPGSFVDSGSNGIFFLTTGQLPGMSDTNCGGATGDWYCPNVSPTAFAATTEGTTGTQEAVDFNAYSATQLFDTNNTAFNDLTGPFSMCFPGPNDTLQPCFDWGLPFFFGRNVFVAIEGRSTPGGNGPYWAF